VRQHEHHQLMFLVSKGEIKMKAQTMKNAAQNFAISSLLMNSSDRFYPARSSIVTGRIDASIAPLLAAGFWWARSYNQGLPAVGGRYVFLRGAGLPQEPCGGWSASASWGACAPSTGEAC
jgi:hypothetical protein